MGADRTLWPEPDNDGTATVHYTSCKRLFAVVTKDPS